MVILWYNEGIIYNAIIARSFLGYLGMRVISMGIYYSPLIQVALLSLFPAWIISRKVYHDEADGFG